MYEEAFIWKRIDKKSVARYRCLRNSATGKYSVQSVDFYRLPLSPQQVAQFEVQFIELFCESDPGERAGVFDSLEEAIAAHERSFNVSG
jgi:hypothetical protein